jgi:serine/threonine protein kinase
MAPEVFKKEGYSYKADIFSVGVVMFHLLTGKYLFYGRDNEEMMENNKNCNLVRFEVCLGSVSRQAQHLMK